MCVCGGGGGVCVCPTAVPQAENRQWYGFGVRWAQRDMQRNDAQAPASKSTKKLKQF
jgi:hypothetical protein